MNNEKGQFGLGLNIYKSYGDTTKIILPSGHITLVDTNKIDIVSKYTWAIIKSKRTNYVKARPREIGYKAISMHRLIMCAKYGEYIDHINHNGLDNRISNLRKCSKAENSRNRLKTMGIHSSKYKGVCKHRNKWQATINGNGVPIYLGLFWNEEEAAEAYNMAALEYHKDYARLNTFDSKYLRGGKK